MFCTSCGKQVSDGSLFCTSCGARLAPLEQPKAASGQTDTGSVETPAIPVDQDVTQTPAPIEESAAPVADVGPVQPKPVTYTPPLVSSSSVVPPKKSSKGILAVIGAVVVVVLLVMLFSSGSGGGYSDYKELVKNYYNAIYKNDANAIIKLFDKDIQKEMKDYKDDIKDTVDTMKTDWDDQYDKGWNKLVETAGRTKNGSLHYIVDVQLDGEQFDTLYIKSVDGKYYLDEENSPFY